MNAPWLSGLQSYGAGAVFVGTLVEACVVPIPTPPFVMGAGALLIPPALSGRQAFLPILLRVALPGAAGTAVGSLLIFGLCYWGGKAAIERYGRYFGLDWQTVHRNSARLEGRLEAAVFATRALPLFPVSLVSAAAGVLRLPPPVYLFWTFAGAVIRYVALGYAGFWGRGAVGEAAIHFARWRSLLLAALAAAMLAALAFGRRARRRP